MWMTSAWPRKAEYTLRLWDEIRVKLIVDDPSPPQRFLGVVQHYFEEPVEKLGYFLDHHPRVRGREAEVQKFVPKDPKLLVRGYRYQMADFFGRPLISIALSRTLTETSLKGSPHLSWMSHKNAKGALDQPIRLMTRRLASWPPRLVR